MIISRSVLLRMRNVLDKCSRENQTIFCVQYFFFRKPWLLWDNVEKYCSGGQATDDNIKRRMIIACWMTKATDTYSEYVTLSSFPRQQFLRESASNLCLYGYNLTSCPPKSSDWFWSPASFVFNSYQGLFLKAFGTLSWSFTLT